MPNRTSATRRDCCYSVWAITKNNQMNWLCTLTLAVCRFLHASQAPTSVSRVEIRSNDAWRFQLGDDKTNVVQSDPPESTVAAGNWIGTTRQPGHETLVYQQHPEGETLADFWCARLASRRKLEKFAW